MGRCTFRPSILKIFIGSLALGTVVRRYVMAAGSGLTKKRHPGPNTQHEEHAPSYHASSHRALRLKDSSTSSVPQAEDQALTRALGAHIS